MKVELREGTASKLRVPEDGKDVLAFDTKLRGFFLRKFVSGQCSYGVKYVVAGRQVRLTLGPAVPGVLAEMRKRAAIVISDARAGRDTAADRKVARTPKPDVLALGGLIERYLADRRGKLRPIYFAHITRQLRRYWEPLHSMAVGDVKRQNVVLVVDRIVTERGPVAADRARSALSGFYSWAIERGLTDTSPVENIAPRNENGSRERVLSEGELAIIWNACGRGDHSTIVRLLILTGQRRSEIADLSWHEINLARQIELPGTRTKNHRGHIVPLSDQALALLPQKVEGRAFLFGRGRAGFSGWSRAKAELDASITAMRGQPLAKWTLHDLRRTFVTMLNERGIASPHVIEALCNHISGSSKGGIAGIYNRATYSVEKREAIEIWGRHISEIIGK